MNEVEQVYRQRGREKRQINRDRAREQASKRDRYVERQRGREGRERQRQIETDTDRHEKPML